MSTNGHAVAKCQKTNKGIARKGNKKLTTKVVNDLTVYYALSIQKKFRFVENMKKAIQATFYHYNSSDENPQQFCPPGSDSWWHKSESDGTLKAFVMKNCHFLLH